MKLTKSELKALTTTHADVVNAIVEGNTVWQFCQGEKKWFTTTAMYAHTPVEDFHIGDVPPSEE